MRETARSNSSSTSCLLLRFSQTITGTRPFLPSLLFVRRSIQDPCDELRRLLQIALDQIVEQIHVGVVRAWAVQRILHKNSCRETRLFEACLIRST